MVGSARAQIAALDGVIFFTPQYNAGYPTSLKNAIDCLGAEWRGLPAAVVSYGGRGGPQSAAQLSYVLAFAGGRPHRRAAAARHRAHRLHARVAVR